MKYVTTPRFQKECEHLDELEAGRCAYLPTSQEIDAMTAKIREGWADDEYHRRSVTNPRLTDFSRKHKLHQNIYSSLLGNGDIIPN